MEFKSIFINFFKEVSFKKTILLLVVKMNESFQIVFFNIKTRNKLLSKENINHLDTMYLFTSYQF